MSDMVLIVLVIAISVIVILLLFRRQLSDFRFKGGNDGVDLRLKTHKEAKSRETPDSQKRQSSASVSGNKLWGRRNKIQVQADKATVDNNQIIGEDQEIDVPSSPRKVSK